MDISVEADELITNGHFDSTTAPWGVSAGGQTVELSGGGLRISTDGTLAYISQAIPVVKGKTYRITGDIKVTSGSGSISFLGDQLNYNSTQSFSFDLVASATTASSTFMLKRTSGGSASDFIFDNISVKEVNPIATGFSTRKINSSYTGKAMRCRNQGNVEVEVDFDSNNEISLSSPVTNTSQNLLAYSEQFTSWTNTSGESSSLATELTDPFGGTNSYLIKSTGSTASSGVMSEAVAGMTAGKNYTLSCYFKYGTSDDVRFGLYDYGGSVWSNVDIVWSASGVPSTSASANVNNITYTPTGSNGWYRVSFNFTCNSSGDKKVHIDADRDATNQTVYAFGAQLEETQYESTNGTEKLTDGGFDNGLTSWIAGGDSSLLSVENGAIRLHTPDGTYTDIHQFHAVTAGKKYEYRADLTFTQDSGNNGAVALGQDYNSSYTQTTHNTSGSILVTRVATATDSSTKFYIKRAGTPTNVLIDNLSVLEFDAAPPSTYAQTPVISDTINNTTATTLGEFAGKENLITYSEDFSNGAWSGSFGSTTTASNITDPLGGTSAYLVTENSANSQHAVIRNTRPNLLAGTHTHSCYVKSNGRNVVRIWNNGTSGSAGAAFNLTTGQFSIFSNATSASIETLSDGWYRISVTFTNVAGNTGPSIYGMPSIDGSSTYQGDGTSGFYLFGFQTNTNSLKDYQKTTSTALTGDVNVVNWYNQGGGGGEDATQDTASKQPRIVMGSELVTDNGKPSIRFDGYDDNLKINGEPSLKSAFWYANVLAQGSNADTSYAQVLFGTGSWAYAAYYTTSSAVSWYGWHLDGSWQHGDPEPVMGQGHVFAQIASSTKDFTLNGNVTQNYTPSSFTDGVGGMIGARDYSGGQRNLNGHLSELLLYPSNMSSSRFQIEQNMIQHFMDGAIYSEDFNNDTGGWLKSENGGSSTTLSHETTNPISGSGSLKVHLTNTGSDASHPRVRAYMGTDVKIGVKYRLSFKAKLISGTAECDIRFGTATLNMLFAGNQTFTTTAQTYTFTKTFDTLAGGTLDVLDFLFDGTKGPFELLIDDVKVEELGVEGFVTTLYDQTGNNCHALQSTAAYQPQLVSGGDLIKSGGHPAWEFTNTSPTFHNLELFGKLQVTLLDAWFVADTAATRYLYPADFDASGNFGWVAEDSSSSTSLIGNYGINADARLYVNNQLTAQHGVNSRGTISTALVGRKLVHHQNNGTGAWDNVMVGWYGGGQAVGGHRPYFYEGKMSEMIWYDSSQSSNRTSIDTAINTHYNIY